MFRTIYVSDYCKDFECEYWKEAEDCDGCDNLIYEDGYENRQRPICKKGHKLALSVMRARECEKCSGYMQWYKTDDNFLKCERCDNRWELKDSHERRLL